MTLLMLKKHIQKLHKGVRVTIPNNYRKYSKLLDLEYMRDMFTLFYSRDIPHREVIKRYTFRNRWESTALASVTFAHTLLGFNVVYGNFLGELEINLGSSWWKKPEFYRRRLAGTLGFSTTEKDHTLLHELGHIVGKEIKNTPIKDHGSSVALSTTNYVSDVGTQSRIEYEAEEYALNIELGNKIDVKKEVRFPQSIGWICSMGRYMPDSWKDETRLYDSIVPPIARGMLRNGKYTKHVSNPTGDNPYCEKLKGDVNKGGVKGCGGMGASKGTTYGK